MIKTLAVFFLLTVLLFVACGTPTEVVKPRPASVAQFGRVPVKLERAVRTYYAEWDMPCPHDISVRPGTNPEMYLVTVKTDDGVITEFIGSQDGPNKWTVFPAEQLGMNFKNIFGLEDEEESQPSRSP